jgi:hypothetical protein
MAPPLLDSLSKLEKMEEDLGIQLVPTFYIFCGLSEAERDLQDVQTLAEQQGASLERLAGMHSARQSIQVLQGSVAALLTSIVQIIEKIQSYSGQGAPTVKTQCG